MRTFVSDRDPLDFVECNFVAGPIVRLGRPRVLMRHRGLGIQCAAGLQTGGHAGGSKRMTSDLNLQARSPGAPLDHPRASIQFNRLLGQLSCAAGGGTDGPDSDRWYQISWARRSLTASPRRRSRPAQRAKSDTTLATPAAAPAAASPRPPPSPSHRDPPAPPRATDSASPGTAGSGGRSAAPPRYPE